MVAFCTQILGGNNTVIRTGFDIKRFTEPYQYFWNNAANYGKAFFEYFDLQAVAGGGPGTFAPGTLSYGDTLPPTSVFPTYYQSSLPQSLYAFNSNFAGAGMDSHIQQPYLEEWNLGVQRQIGANNVLEVRYMGHRAIHQWISINPNEVNIFETGFLKEFQAAQSNLKIYQTANPGCVGAGTCNFGNSGLPGQVDLPIMTTAFGGAGSADFSYSGFVTDLQQGAAGRWRARCQRRTPTMETTTSVICLGHHFRHAQRSMALQRPAHTQLTSFKPIHIWTQVVVPVQAIWWRMDMAVITPYRWTSARSNGTA